jgi:hypothetical protein
VQKIPDHANNRQITKKETLPGLLLRPITDILYSAPKTSGLNLALPVLNPAPPVDARALRLSEKSRAWLADGLLQTNPKLSDRKLLMHLGKIKLASMLIEAMDARDALVSEERQTA